MTPPQIGICTWSLNRDDVRDAVTVARDKLGLSLVQVGFFGPGIPDESADAGLVDYLAASGVRVSATCAGFEGEDYSSIASIRRTGGYAPDQTFGDRFEKTCRMGALTARLGVGLFTVHVGFIPEDPADPKYAVMLERVGRVADTLAGQNVTLTMETGQETAATLARFLADLGRENVKINFDPGNMILYGVGQPVEALGLLRPHVVHVHVKDALCSGDPSVEWGTEVLPGDGDADIPRVISKLRAGGYTRPLIIEREVKRAGGLDDLQDTIRFLRSLGV